MRCHTIVTNTHHISLQFSFPIPVVIVVVVIVDVGINVVGAVDDGGMCATRLLYVYNDASEYLFGNAGGNDFIKQNSILRYRWQTGSFSDSYVDRARRQRRKWFPGYN